MQNDFTIQDLIDRWNYTREGIRKLRKRDPDFPKPYVTSQGYYTNLWRAREIYAYEQIRPELTSSEKKRKKVALFAFRALWGRSQGR